MNVCSNYDVISKKPLMRSKVWMKHRLGYGAVVRLMKAMHRLPHGNSTKNHVYFSLFGFFCAAKTFMS